MHAFADFSGNSNSQRGVPGVLPKDNCSKAHVVERTTAVTSSGHVLRLFIRKAGRWAVK